MNKGFTLIELIIVIGVLGVLAAALLVAIDPIEQLKRGRDAGRLSSVTQLGRAIQTYVAGQGSNVYPGSAQGFSATSWQTVLGPTGSGDIKNVIPATPNPTIDCAAGTSGFFSIEPVHGFCYWQSVTSYPNDFVVWIQAESKTAKSKITGGCASTVWAAYVGSLGRAGYECFASGVNPLTASNTLY